MKPELLAAFEELHKQLEAQETLNDNEQQELRDAVEEIQHSLDKYDVSSASLADRLHQMTKSFADQHPQLTQTAGQIAEMLAQMGI